MQRDPVCGMSIKEKYAKKRNYISRHMESAYYFCSANCKKTFDSDPSKYADIR